LSMSAACEHEEELSLGDPSRQSLPWTHSNCSEAPGRVVVSAGSAARRSPRAPLCRVRRDLRSDVRADRWVSEFLRPLLVGAIVARVPPRGDRPSEEPRESAPFAWRVRGSSRASVRWFVLSGRQRRSRLRRRDPEVLHRVLVRCSADARVLRSSRPSRAPLVSERRVPTGEHRGSRSRFARSLHRTCPCRSPAHSRSDRVAEPVTPSTRWAFGRRPDPRSLSRSSCPRSSPSRASDVEILSGASHRPSRRPVHIAALAPFTSTASITRSHLLVRGRDEHPALSSGLIRPCCWAEAPATLRLGPR